MIITKHEKISYMLYPGKFYLNITNRCSNKCVFCVRNYTDELGGNYLWLTGEPDKDEIISSLKEEIEQENYFPEEIIFCGYGEPMYRPPVIIDTLSILKPLYPSVRFRLNTNGQGILINNGRSYLPELSGLIDEISISLNAHNSSVYQKICNPFFGEKAFDSILDFARESTLYIPHTTLSIVGKAGNIDVNKCRDIARSMGVNFRIR
jgi:TatD family-associated radical SAM protein